MPPYPIARVPLRFSKEEFEEKYGKCLRCNTILEHRPEPYRFMMFCPGCNCKCFFRAEDVLYGNDGLVVPCEEHWTDDCKWRDG